MAKGIDHSTNLSNNLQQSKIPTITTAAKLTAYLDGGPLPGALDTTTTTACCNSTTLSKPGNIQPSGSKYEVRSFWCANKIHIYCMLTLGIHTQGYCEVIKDTSVIRNDAFLFLACCFAEPSGIKDLSFTAECEGN